MRHLDESHPNFQAAVQRMMEMGLLEMEAGVALNRLAAILAEPGPALASACAASGIEVPGELYNPDIGVLGVLEVLRSAARDDPARLVLQWFPDVRAARGLYALWGVYD